MITLAPPRRLERPTNGLGRRSLFEAFHEVESLRGLIVDLSQQAVQAIEAIRAGGPQAWPAVERVLVAMVDAAEAIQDHFSETTENEGLARNGRGW